MKKTVLILIICILQSAISKGQTIEELFLSMPSEIIPTMNQMKRLDLIDLYKAEKKAEIQDIFNNTCSLTALQDDYLRIENETNSLELISLPMINDSQLLLIIKTVCASACDSELRFYTVQWKKLETGSFLNLVDKEWFICDKIDTNDQIVKNTLLFLDIDLMKFSYDPEKKALSQEYQTPLYLDLDQKEKVKNHLKQEVKTYHWTGVRFE